MSEPKKPPQSNSSRTVVIVAVAVLIVVAIAGIVLAGRSGTSPEPAVTVGSGASAVQSSSGSTSQPAGSPTDPLPKNVMFAAGSDKLPAGSNEGLARFAEAARSGASAVRLSARYLTGANKQRDLDLAKARTGAIRHALEANGLNSGRMQIELVEMPEGGLTPDAGNRVDLTFR